MEETAPATFAGQRSIWALSPLDYAVNHRVVDSFNRDANLSSLFFNLQIDSFVAKDLKFVVQCLTIKIHPV